MALMSLDIGTTGCKCAVYSEDGKQLAYVYHEYMRPAGSTEFDGDDIWAHFLEMIPVAIHKAGEKVSALAVTSMGETFAPIGRDGEPMHPFMQSMDPRGIPYMDSIGAETLSRVRQVTGLQPHSRYMLGKLLYLKNEKPEIFRNAWKFMLMEDFILFKLTGRPISDYTISTRTNIFNLDKLGFDEQILSAVGVDADKMCDTVPAGTIVGTVLDSVARITGLTTDVKVVTGGHDSIPEALCSGLLGPGDSALGMGTSVGFTFIVKASEILSDKMICNNFNREPYIVPGCYLSFGVNANSGNLVTWFRDNFYSDLIKEASERNISVYDLIEQRIPVEPSGIVTIPHFIGSSTPDFVSSARGAITGLSLSSTRDQIYRSILEADGFELRFIYENALASGMRTNEIRASGGGAKSRKGLQIRADILGHSIKPLINKDTTVSGCAMLAGKATGVYSSYEEAVEIYTSFGETIDPIEKNANLYDKLYERYRQVRKSLVSIWAAE